ncbi:ABC transporter ATP-binding protein [Clostridium botulinum]|nr:ABC transporter ATP-binding protein [Clostridium botulinum]
MMELALKEVKKYFGGNKILSNITFEIKEGERVGLIGNNGSGKTTIFKIIAGIENKDGGSVFIRKNSKIGYLNQIPEYPEGFKVIDVLNSAFEELHQIKSEMETLESQMKKTTGKDLEIILNKYSNLSLDYENKDGYNIDEKLSKVCTGLKFDESILNKDFANLSGGEKTVVMLGKILLQSPNLLLLDEPSNHLDMECIEWLENYIKSYKGTVVIISHDRYFLDNSVSKMIELEDGEILHEYNGNYSYYIKEKERIVNEQFEAYKDQQKKIKAMEKSIKQLREWAIQGDNESFFKRAESIQKRLDKIKRIDKPVDKAKININFVKSDRSGNNVLDIKDLEKRFYNKLILENLNLSIKYGDKVAIIGNNGTGKSTILKLILNEVNLDKGKITLGHNVKIGYLPQNVSFENEELTVLEVFREDINILEGEARNILAKFLFYGESVFKKVKGLSGGEKSRLKLCKLIQDDINLLILDEPTNHLDIDSREMLEDSLMNFEGTILFVSHDRFFINKIGKRICELENRKVTNYYGDYEYYKEKKSENKIKNINNNRDKKSKTNKVKDNKSNIKNMEKEIKNTERIIEDYEKIINEIDNKINTYTSNYEKLTDLYNERTRIQNELDNTLEKWMNMNS